MTRRKLFLAEENLGGLAEQIDRGGASEQEYSPAMAGVNKTDLEKQIENQLPDSEKVDLSSTNISGGTTLESLGIDLTAALSDTASAMVSSINRSPDDKVNDVEQTLIVQNEEMQPLQDMFFVLQKMHGNLMKGHVNIDDPEDDRDGVQPIEMMMGYEEFGLLAHELSAITGTNTALEAHYTHLPMSQKVKIALETVEVAKKGVLVKAFEVLVKMLKKMIEWLLGPRKTKVEVAGKISTGPMKKILKFMGEAVTGRDFASLTPDDRNDLSKTITALPMEQQLWFFNGRHVQDRLSIASQAAVHKLFADGALIGAIHELEDVIESGDDANNECDEILKKYDFIAESKALAAQDAHDVGPDTSIHDLRDIRKVYQTLDQRADLIKTMEFVVSSKLDEKLVIYQQKWLKDLETLNSHHAASKEEHRRRIVRQHQINIAATFVKMQDKILSDILNFHKAALAVVRWTATTIESKLRTADDETDRHALRQLKKDTAIRISELEDMVK